MLETISFVRRPECAHGMELDQQVRRQHGLARLLGLSNVSHGGSTLR